MMLRHRSKSPPWSPTRTLEGRKTPAGITPMMPPDVATFVALRW